MTIASSDSTSEGNGDVSPVSEMSEVEFLKHIETKTEQNIPLTADEKARLHGAPTNSGNPKASKMSDIEKQASEISRAHQEEQKRNREPGIVNGKIPQRVPAAPHIVEIGQKELQAERKHVQKMREFLTTVDKNRRLGSDHIKRSFPAMLKGGVIMDVMNAEQARIAEAAGACAVMALERIPADIRKDSGVARASDPKMIKEIMAAVSIPVMAKVRIGHFVEAQILEAIGVDCIDESEVLTPADHDLHIDKTKYITPFVCGCRNLGEALRRISEGAAMIRTKGEAGTGDVVEAVKHIRTLHKEIRHLQALQDDEVYHYAKLIGADVSLVKQVKKDGKLPVVNFAAGGVATPADAAMCMQLGVDGVFVGSGIFKSDNPEKRAHAIVMATVHYKNPLRLAKLSEDIGKPMTGIGCDNLADQRWAKREPGNYEEDAQHPAKKQKMSLMPGTAFGAVH